MKIYYLKWSASGCAPMGGSAYVYKERADRHVKYLNERRHWRHRILGHRWVLGTLNLKKQPKAPSAAIEAGEWNGLFAA